MLTSDQLGGLAGVVLSLMFTYVPGLRVRFAARSRERKSLTMLLCLMAVAVGAFAASCGNFIQVAVCTQQGAWTIGVALFWAAVGNQATYQLAPQPQDVKLTVALRDSIKGDE